jgi:hypothetical protein
LTIDRAAADQLLVLTSARSGSTPVVSQSIMKPMVPVGASTEAWRCAAVLLAQLQRLVPRRLGRLEQLERHASPGRPLDRLAVLAHHAQHRLAFSA